MERQALDIDAQIRRHLQQFGNRLRLTAELARQIAGGIGAAERDADQQLKKCQTIAEERKWPIYEPLQ